MNISSSGMGLGGSQVNSQGSVETPNISGLGPWEGTHILEQTAVTVQAGKLGSQGGTTWE